MNVIPLGKEILVKPEEQKKILMQESMKCDYGTVVAVGSEVTKVKAGDVIGYERWGTKEMEVQGEKYTFIAENSDFLLCRIEQ